MWARARHGLADGGRVDAVGLSRRGQGQAFFRHNTSTDEYIRVIFFYSLPTSDILIFTDIFTPYNPSVSHGLRRGEPTARRTRASPRRDFACPRCERKRHASRAVGNRRAMLIALFLVASAFLSSDRKGLTRGEHGENTGGSERVGYSVRYSS